LNIFDFTALYRRTVHAAGLTGSVVNIKLARVPPRTILVLTHVTIEDLTTLYTKVRLAINSSGVIHYIDELQTVAAAELIVSRSEILLGEGDVFFAELTGTTTGDVLKLTAVGWILSI
jgi:hypothetical protein